MATTSKKEHKNSLNESNPCWKGYEPVGTKKKNGKEVPNCVPQDKEKSSSSKRK